MSWGMSWEQFWFGDCDAAPMYRKAAKLREKQKDYDFWLQGLYVRDAIYASIGNVYIEKGSKWIVTGDSTVTNLCAEGTVRDTEGNTVTIYDADDNELVEGESIYTVTVTGTYAAEADMSGAGSIPDQDSFTVERPE